MKPSQNRIALPRFVGTCLSVAASMAPPLLALAALAFFILRSRHGLTFLGFPDETEHLLGGRMIGAGSLLYRDYVDSHGPLIFMMTQLYGVIVGWADPNTARLMVSALFLAAGGAILASPALVQWPERLWAAALFLAGTASLWLVQGFYLVSFYPVAGALAAIALALFAAGQWGAVPVAPPKSETPPAAPRQIVPAFLAGMAIVGLGLTAYSYGPPALLFALAGLWPAWRARHWQRIGAFLTGLAIAALLGLLWLCLHASPAGFLAFHIAFNQVAYAPFIKFGVRSFLESLMPSLGAATLVQALAVCGALVSCLVFLALDGLAPPAQRQTVGIVLAHLGLPLLDLRGATGFQDGPFVIATLALLAIGLARGLAVLAGRRPGGVVLASCAVALLVLGGEKLVRDADATPFGLDGAQMLAQPAAKVAPRLDIPLLEALRAVIPPGERVLALPYWPDFYWNLDRLPMRGFYEYLPWDAAYAKAPWFGQARDVCATLTRTPPALIAVQPVKVWNRFEIGHYMPCLAPFLAARYRPMPGYPFLYLRRDRIPAPGAVPHDGIRFPAPEAP